MWNHTNLWDLKYDKEYARAIWDFLFFPFLVYGLSAPFDLCHPLHLTGQKAPSFSSERAGKSKDSMNKRNQSGENVLRSIILFFCTASWFGQSIGKMLLKCSYTLQFRVHGAMTAILWPSQHKLNSTCKCNWNKD